MIELYVLITLLGLGYVINQNKAAEIAKAEQPPLSQRPSLNKQYMPTVQQQETAKATKSYKDSLTPGSNVVNRVRNTNLIKSQLSGVPTNFSHTNMQPFFRGNMTQNTNVYANKSILENYTGVTDFQPQKKETLPLFKPIRDSTSYINGAPSFTDYEQQYLVKPTIQNNVLPFQQIRVGPGIGQGFSSAPVGGFQQFDLQDQERKGFKDTDELRVADKPKISFESRLVDGQKGNNRGIVTPLEKNRVETFFEQTPDMLLKTTGAQIKETQHPKYNAKYTTRLDTTTSYYGTANNQTKGSQERPEVRSTSKSLFDNFGIIAPSLGHQGLGQRDDYGKANIIVYTNERDLTTVKTHQGNVSSVIKAIVAPIIDIIKPSKKALDTEHPRSFGALQPQIPSKLTMHDTNDIMRTTIKETLIHDADKGNLSGPTKNIVYDTNAIAKTTIKETLLHDADKGNLSGPKKNVVYDTNAIARTTTKQTLIHDSDYLNLKGKHLGIAKGEQVAKTTGRQTIDDVDTMVNLASDSRRGTVQYIDAAKTTLKQTVNVDRDGNIESLAKANAGYKIESFDMKETEKQFTSTIERVGQAGQNINDGYKNAAYDAKETQKEHDSNNEYFGSVQNANTAQTSYDKYENAVIDDLKESILHGRAPTQTGAKTTPGMEIVNLDIKKLAMDEPVDRETLNAERIVTIDKNYAQLAEEALTRLPQEYDSADRLDISILSALKNNEFALKLN